MTHIDVHRWLARVGLVASVSLVLVGCPEDAIDITETRSEAAQNFPISSAFVEPEGTFDVERLTLAGFDVTVSDAFGRSTGILGTFNEDNAFGFPAYSLATLARNGSSDPRLPALADADADVIQFCVMGSPPFAGFDPGVWDLFCAVTNLEPNQVYTVMMVRYALTVSGELDAAATALGEPVSAPDELTVLGGSPGGAPTTVCDFSTPVPAAPNTNPFVLGIVSTDETGTAVIDCLPTSSDAEPTWWRNFDDPLPAGVEDSIPFGPNNGTDPVDLSIPSYNYLVLVEGQGTEADPVPAGPPVMRWQVGHDIDGSGTPINNALAPFPAAALSEEELVAAPGGAGRPDSLTVTFNDLEALTGGVYEAWLVNPATGSAIPAVGTYNRIELTAEIDPVTGEPTGFSEEIVETVPNTASFVGGNSGDGFRHQLIVSDNTLPAGDTLGLHGYLVLTLTETPGGADLPDAQSYWFQFTDQNETPANFFDDRFIRTGTTTFGRFDLANPSASLPYGADGGGLGGFRGDVLSVDLTSISRPPVGYVYVGWLVRPDGSAVRLPDITGPPPEHVSLVNADVTIEPGVVTPKGILEANLRLDASEQGIDFSEFTRFVLTLEPKLGEPGMGFIPTHAGDVPDVIASPPSEGG